MGHGRATEHISTVSVRNEWQRDHQHAGAGDDHGWLHQLR
jgi:hypothetical protein